MDYVDLSLIDEVFVSTQQQFECYVSKYWRTAKVGPGRERAGTDICGMGPMSP